MHQTNKLRRLLRTITLTSAQRTLYRVVRSDVLFGFSATGPFTPRPLYNLGPPRGGARYTPRGGAPSLYLAEDMETAMREYTQISAPRQIAPASLPGAPATFVATVQLERLLDLTERSVRRELGTCRAELAEPWRYRRDRRKPPTQRLGAEAADGGRIQAIQYHSTKGAGDCFVIFTDAVEPPSFVEVNDPVGKLVERIP